MFLRETLNSLTYLTFGTTVIIKLAGISQYTHYKKLDYTYN